MSTTVYQCPACGAGLSFHAEKQTFFCEFCLSQFSEGDLAATDAHAKAQQAEAQGEEFCEQMQEYQCPSCGAQIVCDTHTAADFCYYCHNPVILNGRLSGQKRPTKIIPFQYDKEAAQAKFLAFAKKKKFVPKGFFAKEQAEKIQGVYFPFWITDADTDCQGEGEATRVRTWSSGNYRYTETSYYRIYRGGQIHFEDIVTGALSDGDKQMLEGILPYPSDALQDFSMPYLSGFFAKKRDIEREMLTEEVRGRMLQYSMEILRRTVQNYTTVRMHPVQMQVKQSHWEYALLPVWILTYSYRGKVYTYAMNGYTGKIYGELPLSYPKLTCMAASVFALAGTLITLIGGLFV